jgi:hypothetical protein
MSVNGQVGRVPPVLRDAGEDDGEVYVIGVRESTDPQSWSLLLMEFDDEDDEEDADDELERDDGMDTYCLVVDPGQATYYGGVLECEIAGTELRLVLSADAASTLDMPQRTQFILDLPPDQREMLGRGLQRVLTSGRADAVPQLLRVWPSRKFLTSDEPAAADPPSVMAALYKIPRCSRRRSLVTEGDRFARAALSSR